MELWLTNIFNSNAQNGEVKGKPNGNATILAFPVINRRATLDKLEINYAIAADTTGKTSGEWVLAERRGTTAVKNNIEIGVTDILPSGRPGRTANDQGFGRFFDHCGICVKPLPGGDRPRPVRASYIIRTAPAEHANGTYTAASRPRRIRASGELRPLAIAVRNRNARGTNPATATLRVRRGSATIIPGRNNGAAEFHAERTNIDVLGITGNIEVWTAATARRPATAKQIINRS